METYDEDDRSILADFRTNNKLILSTSYLPPISFFFYFFEFYNSRYEVYIESEENFIKQTYRNRAYISDNNGIHCISVPIESNGGKKIGIKDVLISNHIDWRHNHINAIRTAYGSSPFYEYYKDDIESVIKKPYKRLWDLNEDLIHTIISISDLDLSFFHTNIFEKYTNDSVDLRYILTPKNEEFHDKRIVDMVYYDTSGVRKQEWIWKLSFLDLLFNMGPEFVLLFNSIKSKDKYDFSRFSNC